MYTLLISIQKMYRYLEGGNTDPIKYSYRTGNKRGEDRKDTTVGALIASTRLVAQWPQDYPPNAVLFLGDPICTDTSKLLAMVK